MVQTVTLDPNPRQTRLQRPWVPVGIGIRHSHKLTGGSGLADGAQVCRKPCTTHHRWGRKTEEVDQWKGGAKWYFYHFELLSPSGCVSPRNYPKLDMHIICGQKSQSDETNKSCNPKKSIRTHYYCLQISINCKRHTTQHGHADQRAHLPVPPKIPSKIACP